MKKMDEQKNREDSFTKKFVRKDTKTYRFLRALSFLPAYLLYRPVYRGRENIPEEGAVIIASNHIHMCDPVFVMLSTKRVVRYLAKKELHDSPLGFIYDAANTIPVDRKGGAHDSIVAARKALEYGEVIGIFPEGTRNKEMKSDLLDFKIGAVKIARDTGARIVPMAYTSGGRPFLDPYRIVVGEAYTVDKDSDLNEENEKLKKKISDLLEECKKMK